MLDALFGTKQKTSPSRQETNAALPLLLSEQPTQATLRQLADDLLGMLGRSSLEKVFADLHELDDRVTELLQIWEFLAKVFPENSVRYASFMALNRQIIECYNKCLRLIQDSPLDEAELLNIIQETHSEVSLLVELEISKRIAGQKPLHRLVQQKASSPEEQAQLERWINRLIREGANPKDTTKIYQRGFFRALLDALSHFPRIDKMYRAFFENPKRDVFAVSQSSDVLGNALKKQQTLLSGGRNNPAPQESLQSALLAGVRNVLDLFATPVKPWAEKLNPSHGIAQLIGLHEELLGQRHLQEVHQYLLARDREITGDFFRIISDFKTSTDANRFKKVNSELKEFFNRLGINNIAEVFFNIESMLEQASLENSLEIQILYYLIAYIYKAHNVNREGMIIEKYQEDFDAQVEKCLKILEAVDFSPAYALHTKLNTVDFTKIQQISIQGALLGNRQCQYTLCGHYFAHLTGTLNRAVPPAFEFPKEVNKEIVIEWAKAARDEGYTDGLAHMQNFMTNFFGAAYAYYEVGELTADGTVKVTPKQKDRIKEIADVVKAISGDKRVNQFADEILNLQGEKDTIKSQFKDMQAQASTYLVSEYAKQFQRTTRSIDKVLGSSLMNEMFERHAVFEMLSCIEHEMNIEKDKLQSKGSETAEIYLYPLRYIRELKRDLVTETDQLWYLHTNNPDLIMQESEKLLRELYQNVKAKEEVSASHKTSLRTLKHNASKWALHILPKDIAPKEMHRTKAIAASYSLYQAARKISAGKASGQNEIPQDLGVTTPRTPRTPISLRSPRSPRGAD